jgi:hypothetical protein
MVRGHEQEFIEVQASARSRAAKNISTVGWWWLVTSYALFA